jgi:acyl-coenzyme A thioesterase PaaI-like protein
MAPSAFWASCPTWRGYRRAMADSRIQVPPNCELTLGMTCVDKSIPGRTVWRMRADERFANPAGIVQGGFLGVMADSAMGSAAVTWAKHAGRKVFASNVEMKTSFLAAATVDSLLEWPLPRPRWWTMPGGSWPGPAPPTSLPSAVEPGSGRGWLELSRPIDGCAPWATRAHGQGWHRHLPGTDGVPEEERGVSSE